MPMNDEIWLPTLAEIRHLATHGTPAEQLYYSQFGWHKLEIPASATHVSSRMTTLETRFFERYALRHISQETLTRWQLRLQNRMDEVVDEYNRAYILYEDNATAMMDDVLPGTKTSIDNTDTASGSDSMSGNSKTKTADTPDSAINDSDSYADRVEKTTSQDTTTYGKKSTIHGDTVTQITGGAIVSAINESIRQWMDIDTAFIGEFEDLFLNVFDYRGDNRK